MNIPLNDDIRNALNYGSTLSTRLFISLGALLQGCAFLLQTGSWLSHPSFQALNSILPIELWGYWFLAVGSLGLWRVLSKKSRPWVAGFVNVLTVLVWTSAVVTRFWGTGPTSLCSLYTAYFIASMWVLLRTRSTPRDEATA